MSHPLLDHRRQYTRQRVKLNLSASGFLYVPLPAGLAANITSEMNRAGASKLLPTTSITRQAVEEDVDRVFDQWMLDQWTDHLVASAPLRSGVVGDGYGAGQVVFDSHGDERTMGYVTKDACPGSGDDIDHVPGKPPPLLILSVRPHRSFLLHPTSILLCCRYTD